MELTSPIITPEEELKAESGEIKVDFLLKLWPKNLEQQSLELSILENKSARLEILEIYIDESQNYIKNYLC